MGGTQETWWEDSEAWNATQQDFTWGNKSNREGPKRLGGNGHKNRLNISRFSVCILGKSSILENSILPDSYAMFVYTF